MKQVHVFVSGRVQGVFFRAFTRKAALSLNLCGWARNLGDGRVEALAEGEEDALKKFIAELRMGPPASQVDDLEVEWGDDIEGFKGFEIRY